MRFRLPGTLPPEKRISTVGVTTLRSLLLLLVLSVSAKAADDDTVVRDYDVDLVVGARHRGIDRRLDRGVGLAAVVVDVQARLAAEAPRGIIGDELMLEHLSDHLDLTDAQRQSIENIVEASKPEMQAIREQARANRQAIRTLDTSDPSYETALNNIAVSNGELATAGTLLAVRVRNEVHAVLTDEQREKLERSKQRMQKRLKRQMDPR